MNEPSSPQVGIEIKAGDVVRLKSFGPSMTVEKVIDDEAKCRWFILDEVRYGNFSVASLMLVK